MPSVGMRRNTRVFGARVLRSGRRLWTGSGEGKHMRAAEGEEWMELLDNSGDGGGDAVQCKENGWHDDVGLKQEIAEMDIEEKLPEPEGLPRGSVDDYSADRMWGAFYQRKRKRMDSKSFDFSCHSENMRDSEDRKYGKQFFRKQWRKRIKQGPVAETCDSKPGFVGQDSSHDFVRCRVLAAVVEPSCSSSSWFSCFLNLVLRYMRRARMSLPQLSAFVFSNPIARVYSSYGIQFFPDSPSSKRSGGCKIFGARCSIPLFAVDFSAVPLCFMQLHSSLLLRSACLSHVLVIYSMDMDSENDRVTDDEEQQSCTLTEGDQSGSKNVASVNENSRKRRVLHPTARTPKLTGRSVHLRNGVNSRSIQKRRSSLRSRRGRNASVFSVQKTNGGLVSDLFRFRHDEIPFSPVVSSRELRSSVQRTSTTNIKALKSTLVGLNPDLDSASCSANILVIESDKCYREEGAFITLEISASKQWFLVVTRDGIRKYSLSAQKIMRSCSCNRYTHAIIWTGDNGWKLEFTSRRDWLIFKDLYKQCSDRNMHVSTINIIPVPGVHEAPGYADRDSVPFMQPDSYITVKDDELARALAKSTANYDMDSDDEEWLKKFNNESCAENKIQEPISAERFELIIDAFEKGFYCSPDDCSDEKAAVNLCQDLERREVVEAMHGYWMKKRKQKRSALVRIFQCYQPRRAQLIPKAVMRKKRSFKRQASLAGRGKQRTLLQALAAEQDALEEQNAIRKVQETTEAANRSEGVAVLRRRRAQLLMENADLAAYKATIALRIAEAAQIGESLDVSASFFLS